MAQYNIKIGDRVALEFTLFDSDGIKVKGTSTWTSSDDTIATVQSMYDKTLTDAISGETADYTATYPAEIQKASVTGVSAGSVTITCTSNGHSATATVRVSANNSVSTVG